MACVVFVKSIPTKKRVELGVFSDAIQHVFTVSEATYKSLGEYKVGDEIAENDLGTLRFEDEYLRALKRATSSLSLSDKSRFALKTKLIQAGFSGDASDMALDRLAELGYLDEERQLERAVEKEANYNLRGRYYIKRKLAAKGYSSSSVSRAIDALVERGEIDFPLNFERLAQKKGALTDDERLALQYKFGYKI